MFLANCRRDRTDVLLWRRHWRLTGNIFYVDRSVKPNWARCMKHFPIFTALKGRRVALSGGGDAALAKLRLLMKTNQCLRIVQKGDPVGYQVIIGGGLGRTPMIGKILHDFLPEADLLPYLEAVVSVWNLLGQRG